MLAYTRRARLERIGKSVDSIPQRHIGRQREAVPQNDELSSAVSRVNAAPWEDPFALALGEAAEAAEEGNYSACVPCLTFRWASSNRICSS